MASFNCQNNPELSGKSGSMRDTAYSGLHHSLGLVPELCKGREMKSTRNHECTFLSALDGGCDVNGVSSSCYGDFRTVMGCNLELWAKINPHSLSCFWSGYLISEAEMKKSSETCRIMSNKALAPLPPIPAAHLLIQSGLS